MTNFGEEFDSDSSEEEWVITSTKEPQVISSKQTKTYKKKEKRLTISSAAIRTIKANLPPSALPPFQPSPSLQYISDNELETICTEMDSKTLVERLIQVYKSCEIYLRIREIETVNGVIEIRLKNHLHLCSNPTDFIINTLMEISTFFLNHSKNTDLNTKFRKLLVNDLCSALSKFYETPVEKRFVEEKDLISFDDEQEKDLISFDDVIEQPLGEEPFIEEDHDSVSDSDDEIIMLPDSVPMTSTDRYTLTREHQQKIMSLIDTMPTPTIIYYAIDTFKLVNVISLGCQYESEGIKLATTLLKHGHFQESVACIRKLNLFKRFPIDMIADHFFTAGYGMSLADLYKDHLEFQQQLLLFINKQLRFNYAGNLGIVPQEFLQDLVDGTDTTVQLSRLKERKFQKDLVNCASKVMKDADIQQGDEYYFIFLSQRYAQLRYILAQRVIQQSELDDYSVEASSNYNGLIDLVCENDPVLAKLAIKELIDIGDIISPPYFASLYKQQEFYCRYNSLPFNQRLLGVVKGEQMSKHKSTFSRKKGSKIQVANCYQLPPESKCIIVDSKETLLAMKDILSISNICGLDTEWLPGFATANKAKTALMQIATDIDSYVFLLDLKTIYKPENINLYRITEYILKYLFEDKDILKLAFDFNGDLDLLHSSLPSSQAWNIRSFVDFKSLSKNDSSFANNGLNGTVQSVLGVGLNKKQQLSNWEKRPLSQEQIVYAACDASCLLDIYFALCQLNHPFVHDLPKHFARDNEPLHLSIKSINLNN